MSTDNVFAWSATPGSNLDVAGNGIQGSSNLSLGNDVFQNVMAQIASGTILRGTDIATSATLDFTAVGVTTKSLIHDLTGTVTVTAVTLTASQWRLCRAQGVFQITASATLIVNGSTLVNYTTTAGDLIVIFGYGSSTVRVWTFTGGPVAAATTSVAGITKRSTVANALAGLETDTAVTPAGLYYPTGHLFGLTLSNGTDATNDIDIAIGTCRSLDDTTNMALASILTKQLDAAWAVGTNAGGLDTGSIANTTYHIWLIKRPDTGVVDALFSASASAPTMPTNYTLKRRIGSIVRASAAIKAFVQDGDEFQWKVQVGDVSATNPTTSAVTRTLTLPTGIRIKANIAIQASAGAANSDVPLGIFISDLSITDTAAGTASNFTQAMYTTFANPLLLAWTMGVFTNTSAQIRSRVENSTAGLVLKINTLGWTDTRGRTV